MPKGRRLGVCYGSKTGAIHAAVSPGIRQIEWAAGFLEGEGSFRSSGTRRGCTEHVNVAQQQREPLGRMQRYFGGKIAHYTPKTRSRPYYTWNISGERARGVILTVFALMSPRRQGQIRDSLQHRAILQTQMAAQPMAAMPADGGATPPSPKSPKSPPSSTKGTSDV